MDLFDRPSFKRIARRRLVGEDLTRNAINFSRKIAVRDVVLDRAWTFAEFERRVNWVAQGLRARYGLAPGARMGLLGRNYLDTLTLYYAASRIGAVTVPLNYRANADELAFVLDDCTPALIAVATELAPTLDRRLTTGRRVITYGDERGDDDLARLVGTGPAEAPDLDLDEWAPAYIMYTGGTTGRPKGVVQAQANYVALADNQLAALAPLGFGRTDSYLQSTPLYHGGGWALSMAFLRYGLTVHVMREFETDPAIAELASGRVSFTWFVPTMSRRIVDRIAEAGGSDARFDAVRFIISAGAPLDPTLREEMKRRFRRARVINVVGQTEVTSTVIALSELRDLAAKADAVGLPVPGITIAILDERGAPLPPGEVGELCYRGDQLMLGYWNKPEQTSAALAGGWFHSGDLAKTDDDGTIFLVGRKKEIIISGGVNIVPNEIEDVIRSVAGVADACVVGLADAEWGERVHAVVALVPGAPADAAQNVKAHCRRALSGYKQPKGWSFVDRLPVSPVGKVDKAKVRAIAAGTAQRLVGSLEC